MAFVQSFFYFLQKKNDRCKTMIVLFNFLTKKTKKPQKSQYIKKCQIVAKQFVQDAVILKQNHFYTKF